MKFRKNTKKGGKKGRPRIDENERKSNIYTERMMITLTPDQKNGLEILSKQFENSMSGYIRHLINQQIRLNGVDL